MLTSLQVALAFLQPCDLWRKEGCGLREKAAEKGADAVDCGVAGCRSFLLRLLGLRRGRCSRWWCSSRRSILCNWGCVFNGALENECGTNAHTSHEDDELRIEIVGLHFCGCVVGEWWHENLIDRSFFCRGFWRRRGSFRRSFLVGFLHFFGSWEPAEFGLRRRRSRVFCDLQFARTVGDAAA